MKEKKLAELSANLRSGGQSEDTRTSGCRLIPGTQVVIQKEDVAREGVCVCVCGWR